MGGRATSWLPLASSIAAVTLAVALMLVLALESISDLESRNVWVVHTHQVLDQTSAIVAGVTRAESEARAYAFTGDPIYAQSYNDLLEPIQKSLGQLSGLISDNSAQRGNVRRLRETVTVKVQRMSDMVAARRSGGLSAALKFARTKHGVSAMDRVREAANQIVEHENRLLVVRKSRATESRQRSIAIVVVSMCTLAALIYGAILASSAFAHQRHRYLRLVSSIGDGFCSISREWRVVHFNEAAEKMFGIDSGAVMGHPFFDLFPRTAGTVVEDNLRTVMRTRKPSMFSAESPSAERQFEYHVFPSDEGISLLLHDITDRLEAEAEILRLNATLEQRVLDRTAQLEGFCYSIAHDMRMHIRGVSTNAALLVEDLQSGKKDTGGRFERLKQSTRHMADLVDDLLAFARSSAKSLARKDVDLTGEAHAVASRVKAEEEYARDVSFDIQPNLHVNADPQLAAVVLFNLFDNASKYRRPGVEAVVKLESAVVDGMPVLVVRDNGLGFDQVHAERIFKPFERLHSDLAIPGSGIGLANVQRILARHGGAIWAESEPGQGSSFYFTFGNAGVVSAGPDNALLM